MAKVLLLGGTGAIGSHLQRAALERGHEVHVTSRKSRESDDVRLVFHKGDALNVGYVTSLASKHSFDVIVDFMVYTTADFAQRVDDLLLTCGHYVYLSSYRVFADTGGAAITEDSPKLLGSCGDVEYLVTDEYALAKMRQEALLRSKGHRNWTIVRPSISYAANRLQFGCLEARAIMPRANAGLPVIIPSEMMDRQTTLTWAGDVGRMIAALLDNGAAMGEDFNVLTGESRTWREIAEIYRATGGLKVEEVSLDDYLSLGVNPYQLAYDRMIDRKCDNSKILAMLDPSERSLTAPETGLSDAIVQSDVGSNTFSRLHGRMDAICGLNRVTKAPDPSAAAQYLAGRLAPINKIIARRKTRMFAPPLIG